MTVLHFSPASYFLMLSLLVIVLPFVLWRQKRIKKYAPLVVVQIAVALALSPSGLGAFIPGVTANIFSQQVMGTLTGLIVFTLMFFGFFTGMEFDPDEVKDQGKAFHVTGVSSILVPFIAGCVAAWFLFDLYPGLVGPHANRQTFAAIFGIFTAVSALPVLGAILQDTGWNKTKEGRIALGFAGLGDGALWLGITGVTIAAGAGEQTFGGMVVSIVGTAAMVFTIFKVVRPGLRRLYDRGVLTEEPKNGQWVIIIGCLLCSALAAELLGVHYLFGAFLYGTVIPKPMKEALEHKMSTLVSYYGLPLYFMSSAYQAKFDLSDKGMWVLCVVLTLVSATSKMLGTAIPARYFGDTWRSALTKGSLLRTKGMMELVAAGIALGIGLITQTAYTAVVMMTLIETFLTKPSVMLIKHLLPETEARVANSHEPLTEVAAERT